MILAGVALAFMAAIAELPAAGQGIANVTVNGSQVSITISLPLGLGADVTLGFENAVGLSLANLGISAQVVNPLDPNLLARLPGGTIPLTFPVLLRIEPPASGGLSFSGVVSLDIHTHNLQLTIPCPLRLFHAPIGGPFEDMTAGLGTGSYRARGTMGGFSEFLIALDLRSLTTVINAKLDALDHVLSDNADSMPADLYADLAARLATLRHDATQGSALTAISDVDNFTAVVVQHSGTDIPNVWRSSRDLVDVAGLLRADAATLRFSLGLKSDGLSLGLGL
jgi:hypothetical protein